MQTTINNTPQPSYISLYVGISLFFLGILGILSLLSAEELLPEDIKQMLLERFSLSTIKLIIVGNSAVQLLIMVIVGTLLYKRMGFRVPLIESFFSPSANVSQIQLKTIITHGLLGGVIAGGGISILSILFMPFLPEAYQEASNSVQLPVIARFLFGGITEEILIRFGLMTLLTWLFSLIATTKPPIIYWLGIILAAVLFGLGHLPILVSIVPDPTPLLYFFIIAANGVAGLIFGYLYWKNGLESAMLAHIMAHVAMLGASLFG